MNTFVLVWNKDKWFFSFISLKSLLNNVFLDTIFILRYASFCCTIISFCDFVKSCFRCFFGVSLVSNLLYSLPKAPIYYLWLYYSLIELCDATFHKCACVRMIQFICFNIVPSDSSNSIIPRTCIGMQLNRLKILAKAAGEMYKRIHFEGV